MPERRHLVFDRIDAIMPDVDRLIAGHTTVGQWTLGAICDHLARTIHFALEADPVDVPATREQAIKRRFFFRAKAFPEGQTPPHPGQIPAPDADALTTAESLRSALVRLESYVGPFPPHPYLGPLSRDEWHLFHARHAAHHLSFAVPT